MEIKIIRAGMLTTVQDLGRVGHRADGVPKSGAMDTLALRVANLMVGNPENTPALEVTLVGPELVFSEDAWVAVTGAEFLGVMRRQPFLVKAGEPLSLGPAIDGCRAYVATAGGLKIEPVLDSASTNLRDALGGHEGRALRDGDVLHTVPAHRAIKGGWRIDELLVPLMEASPTLRVIRGAQAHEFSADALAGTYQVSPRSDRMGLRLSGPNLQRTVTTELQSSAVTPGTLQVPPDGQPILLMADAQTIGGYPQLAQVITVDLGRAAQLRPGDSVHFKEVTLDESHAATLAQEKALGFLRAGLAKKIQ